MNLNLYILSLNNALNFKHLIYNYANSNMNYYKIKSFWRYKYKNNLGTYINYKFLFTWKYTFRLLELVPLYHHSSTLPKKLLNWLQFKYSFSKCLSDPLNLKYLFKNYVPIELSPTLSLVYLLNRDVRQHEKHIDQQMGDGKFLNKDNWSRGRRKVTE